MSLRRLTEEEADKGGSESAKGANNEHGCNCEARFFSLRGGSIEGWWMARWMAAMGSRVRVARVQVLEFFPPLFLSLLFFLSII